MAGMVPRPGGAGVDDSRGGTPVTDFCDTRGMAESFHEHRHMVHIHRDVQGGPARAAVFGVSDGLVSNVALILGIAGASTDGSLVRLAGVSGLLAGAISMAAGEWVSVTAQNELIERELDIERRSLAENPRLEIEELAAIYRERGVDPEHADRVAADLMADPDVALDVHAREELGIDPGGVASAIRAALVSFWAFTVGAVTPLVPWFVTDGDTATIASVVVGLVAAALVGVALASFTERSRWRTATRQVLVAGAACTATYLIGTALGVSIA
ncbi:MAG: VIT1/CCC1 transporter family protein [Acidimicrobiales bacterium]